MQIEVASLTTITATTTTTTTTATTGTTTSYFQTNAAIATTVTPIVLSTPATKSESPPRGPNEHRN